MCVFGYFVMTASTVVVKWDTAEWLWMMNEEGCVAHFKVVSGYSPWRDWGNSRGISVLGLGSNCVGYVLNASEKTVAPACSLPSPVECFGGYSNLWRSGHSSCVVLFRISSVRIPVRTYPIIVAMSVLDFRQSLYRRRPQLASYNIQTSYEWIPFSRHSFVPIIIVAGLAMVF